MQEADAWRREGRIDAEFHSWLAARYPAEGDAGTQRLLQRILVTVAGILVLVGIFTLVAEFWSEFARISKFLILIGFAVAAGVVGLLLGFLPATRLLSHGVVPLALPLYLFAMQYVSEPRFDENDTLLASEVAAVAVGMLLGIVGLLVGLWRYPGLALAAAPTVCFSLVTLEEFMAYSIGSHLGILWTTLVVVGVFHAFFLLLWTGILPIGYAWTPFAARLGWAANVPFGFVALIELVDIYVAPGYALESFDATWTGVPLTAAYLSILLVLALRLGLPELTAICGALLVGDAMWLGGSQGGVIGAVLAIFAAAAGFAVLAQRGILQRIFRPRAPPTAKPD